MPHGFRTKRPDGGFQIDGETENVFFAEKGTVTLGGEDFSHALRKSEPFNYSGSYPIVAMKGDWVTSWITRLEPNNWEIEIIGGQGSSQGDVVDYWIFDIAAAIQLENTNYGIQILTPSQDVAFDSRSGNAMKVQGSERYVPGSSNFTRTYPSGRDYAFACLETGHIQEFDQVNLGGGYGTRDIWHIFRASCKVSGQSVEFGHFYYLTFSGDGYSDEMDSQGALSAHVVIVDVTDL